MTKASTATKRAQKGKSSERPNPAVLRLGLKPEQDADKEIAETLSQPEVRAASVIQQFDGETIDFTFMADELRRQTATIQSGDMSRPEAMLAAQAHTLDALFSNLAKRAQSNMVAGYGDATERYLRLALKAQAQSVRTIEALAELKYPKTISFIGQANIANGHQQINNTRLLQAGEKQTEQTKLSTGGNNELLPNTRAQSNAGSLNQTMEAVGALHRTKNAKW